MRLWVGITLAALAAAAVAGVATTLLVGGRSDAAAVGPSSPYRGSRPPGGIRVPDLTLRSYHGPLVSLRRPAGRVLVVTGVDSKCKESCPILVRTVAAALPLLAPTDRAQVRAIAYSVDPRVDSAAHVRRFLREQRALRLEYLVDSIPRMRPLWRQLNILSAIDSGNADTHSADVRVYDRQGVWVSTLHAGVDLTAANLAHDVRAALRRSAD